MKSAAQRIYLRGEMNSSQEQQPPSMSASCCTQHLAHLKMHIIAHFKKLPRHSNLNTAL